MANNFAPAATLHPGEYTYVTCLHVDMVAIATCARVSCLRLKKMKGYKYAWYLVIQLLVDVGGCA